MTVYGPVNQNITVLTAVNLPDGSQYSFEYNNYGLVKKINCTWSYGGTPTMHNYVSYDFTTSANDCPRVSARHDWAAHWNGDTNEVPATNEEATTTFGTDGGGARWMVPPDATVYKEFYGSGWQAGLPQTTEVWDWAGTKQKWTTISWTQDNTSVGYLTNPRVTDSYIHDALNNVRRTSYGYYTYTRPSGASCSLLADTSEYAADGTTVYRRTHQARQLDSGYMTRGFIGLLHEIDLYDGNNVLQAQSALWYDYGGNLLQQGVAISRGASRLWRY